MNKHVYTEILHESIINHAQKDCLHIKRQGRYQTWTYNDFHKDLNRLCSMLKKHGLKKGTNAIVIGENSPEWVIAYNGIILSGACTVPVDPNIPPSEIETILSTTETKIVFCSRVYLPLFRKLKEKYNHLERIILLDPNGDDKEPSFIEYIKAGNEDKDAFLAKFTPDDPIVIIFTSGTTGRAKGAVLCQKNFTSISQFAIPRMKADSHDTMCAVLPLHHVFGSSACIAAALGSGMDVVFVPYVKGPLILEALKDKGVTILPAVPKMITLFYDSIMHNVKKKGPLVKTVFTGLKTVSAIAGDTLGDNFKRSLFSGVHRGFGGKLRLIISGGAALNKRYWNGFQLMGFNILEGYGLTETYGPITVCPSIEPRSGSVGPALEENEIKILDPDYSGIGEVLLRGTCVFKGYYKNEELTRDVIDQEGWFHTGDLGSLDKDNFLSISGRKKDMIVLDSGKNVYPDELEDYYGASLLIEEIGIFGINQNEGEIVAAAIVPVKDIRKNYNAQQATDLIYDELIRLGKTLPVYRRITDFITVYTELPRTTTRKLKKQDLRKLYNSIKRKSGNRPISEDQLTVIEMALMNTDEYRGIIDAIMKISPKIDQHIINPRSHLEIDLGMDSLRRIELLSQIEQQFKIEVPEEIFDKMETVGDIVSLLREHKNNSEKISVEKIMGLKERILSHNVDNIKFPQNNLLAAKTGPLIQKVASIFYTSRSKGSDLLRIYDKPLIFAANHSHTLDAFWILNALPHSIKKNTYIINSKGTSNYPAIHESFHKQNILKLEKCDDSIELLKAYLSIVRNQKHLIIFPEGSKSKIGKLSQFKSGIGLLARETGAAIVPVKIAGQSHLTTSSTELKNSKRAVLFGKPITYSELILKGIVLHDSSPEDISEYIRSIIAAM